LPPEAKDFSARCYCGACSLSITAPPQAVTYCHCVDCKRWTGAPAPAFAGFDAQAIEGLGTARSHSPGVARWNCDDCGSPIAARFDYLPDQIYVPLGIIDQADSLPPSLHCHDAKRLAWLHPDDLPRDAGSGRARLNAGAAQ
jgi:hypothetical protein